ncbi:nicotinate-nucleotide--dimethylbenzimidazole phosphoribosyltransferase [Sporosarcina sp. CAU 1771]
MLAGTIASLDKEMGQKATEYMNTLTKPIGSLGRLEELAIQIVEITGDKFPTITPPGILVFASDHGVVKEGVSAFPQEVTRQMVSNIVQGGAAINVFGRLIDAEFRIVDVGVAAEITETEVIHKKIRNGTDSFLTSSAMTKEEAQQAVKIGYEEAISFLESGVKCLIVGEVGIGNTTTSSALLSAITGTDAELIVGYGTGISSAQHEQKIDVVRKAIKLHNPNAKDPIDILSKVGGFEIAAMAGAMVAAAEKRIPILLDGFICTVAGCIAELLSPTTKDFMISGHQSAEPGHKTAINHLGIEPILNLNMRLGEGTGAAVAYPILQSSVNMLKEMATFKGAGVAGKDE